MAILQNSADHPGISRVIEGLMHQSGFTKRLLAMGCDTLAVTASVILAWYMRTEHLPEATVPFLKTVGLALLCSLPAFLHFGCYKSMFRYAGDAERSALAKAILTSAVPFALIITLGGIPGVPRVLGLFCPAMLLLLATGVRGIANVVLRTPGRLRARQSPGGRALIYGAGAAGVELLAGLRQSPRFEIVGFLDDNRQLVGRSILGIPVFDPAKLSELKDSRGVETVLLAMPSIGRRRKSDIIAAIREQGMLVQTMPTLSDLFQGRVAVTDLHDVDVIDLLGRDPVDPSPALLRGTVERKVILVTGAGGSIGSELCRQLLRGEPSELILVEHSEFALYSMVEELKRIAPDSLRVHAVLGSVTNEQQMEDVFERYRPDTVYHAAAYKHVPLVESNACEAIFNNVFGTLTLAQIAQRRATSHFILVSTDKAVRPTSVMGATKRLAEMAIQALSARGEQTSFSIVRFGNVLGSSGSVIPLFRRQIEEGGPITVTDPEITRFFMTISEASQLVLQAASMAQGGDVFLLDMGEPMKIVELARAMIRLSGLRVRETEECDGDIEIVFTGLRPGEKLYEELLIDAEALPTQHSRIFRANERFIAWSQLSFELDVLRQEIARRDLSAALARLTRLVPGFERKQVTSASLAMGLPTVGRMERGDFIRQAAAS